MWGYLKFRVYQSLLANLDELQKRVTQEVNILREVRQTLCRVFTGVLHRAQKCTERRGGHLED